MLEPVKAAFEPTIITLPLDAILAVRQITVAQRLSGTFRRIAKSIAEIGIIEPPVVARPKERDGRYLLLDGHLRLAILSDSGAHEVRCLVSDDDEAFTYNKRINRLATIQEHFMIVRALERGVPEDKLAKALDVDVNLILRKRALLAGICPEVVNLLKDKAINNRTFDAPRRMKPIRQIEAAELMTTAGNFTSNYAKALLAATRQNDLLHPDRPKKIRGITPEQMVKMEHEMETLQRDFKTVEASYGDDVLNLVIAIGYLSKLVGNKEVEKHLQTRYPEILGEFRVIISTTSLDQADSSTHSER